MPVAIGERNRPEELDALVAAPEWNTLLMENGQVRVLDTECPGAWGSAARRWTCALFIKSWRDLSGAAAPGAEVSWFGPLGRIRRRMWGIATCGWLRRSR